MQYVNEFSECYIRCDRNDCIRPLRCFPSCAAAGHRRKKCGEKVKLQVENMPIEESLVFMGHIRQCSVGHLQFKKGDVITLKDVQLRQRKPPWDFKRLLPGQILPHGQVVFDSFFCFDTETVTREKCTAWYYELTQFGQRADPHKRHCYTTYRFRASTNAENDAPALELVDYVDSTPFRVKN